MSRRAAAPTRTILPDRRRVGGNLRAVQFRRYVNVGRRILVTGARRERRSEPVMLGCVHCVDDWKQRRSSVRDDSTLGIQHPDVEVYRVTIEDD